MREQKWNWNILSRNRSETYGITIIWIMFLHGAIMDKVQVPQKVEWLWVILIHGNVGVDIFLFLSGIGLYYSFVKNQDLSVFLYKRLMRILLPYLLIATPYFGYVDLIQRGRMKSFFMDMTLQSFWFNGSHLIWYVNMILLCYLLYPYLYAVFFGKKKNTVLRCLIVVMGVVLFTVGFKIARPKDYADLEILFTRLPIFIIGSACGKLVYEKKKMPRASFFLIALIVICSFPILKYNWITGIYQRYYYAILAVALCFAMAWIMEQVKWEWVHRCFSWFGSISLELYLVHILLRSYFMHSIYYNTHVWRKWMFLMILSTVLAYLVSKVTALIRKLCDRWKVQQN